MIQETSQADRFKQQLRDSLQQETLNSSAITIPEKEEPVSIREFVITLDEGQRQQIREGAGKEVSGLKILTDENNPDHWVSISPQRDNHQPEFAAEAAGEETVLAPETVKIDLNQEQANYLRQTTGREVTSFELSVVNI